MRCALQASAGSCPMLMLSTSCETPTVRIRVRWQPKARALVAGRVLVSQRAWMSSAVHSTRPALKQTRPPETCARLSSPDCSCTHARWLWVLEQREGTPCVPLVFRHRCAPGISCGGIGDRIKGLQVTFWLVRTVHPGCKPRVYISRKISRLVGLVVSEAEKASDQRILLCCHLGCASARTTPLVC